MATYKDSLMYNKEHSISFAYTSGNSVVLKNTWQHFHLIPTSRPVVNPPEVKTNYVDIPGANGSLDYTEVLDGVKYGNRTGSWEFMVANGYAEWYEVYNEILSFFHGKMFKVQLCDDKTYYYEGRLSVNQWKSDQKYSTITIDYNFNPYKMPARSTSGVPLPNVPPFENVDPNPENNTNPDAGDKPTHSGDPIPPSPGPGPSPDPGSTEVITLADWLWNEVFGTENKIYHGKFTVEGTKYRNFYNPNAEVIPIVITTSSNEASFTGTITYKGEQLVIESGQATTNIDPGDNEFYFSGSGTVVVSYSTGAAI